MTRFSWTSEVSKLCALSPQQFVNTAQVFLPLHWLLWWLPLFQQSHRSLYLPVGLSSLGGSSLSCVIHCHLYPRKVDVCSAFFTWQLLSSFHVKLENRSPCHAFLCTCIAWVMLFLPLPQFNFSFGPNS